MVRLPANTGPAGGFRAGLIEAFADPVHPVGLPVRGRHRPLRPSPTPPRRPRRPGRGRSAARAARPEPLVAYGRTFVGRGAHTVNLVPPPGAPGDFTPVDVACWGATLVSRAVVEAGVLPDPEWFFGLEDFDFFCRVREAGFEVLVDDDAARRVADQQTDAGRGGGVARPAARRRRRGVAGLLPRPEFVRPDPPARPAQLVRLAAGLLGPSPAEGPWPGRAGRHRSTACGTAPSAGWGENPRYVRRVGEFGPDAGGSPDPAR